MSIRDTYTVGENVGAGNGSDLRIQPGGIYTMQAKGTWGGGSIKLQVKDKNGNYGDVANSTLSADGMSTGLYLPAGVYRYVIATASAVYAYLYPVDRG